MTNLGQFSHFMKNYKGQLIFVRGYDFNSNKKKNDGTNFAVLKTEGEK